MSTKTPLVIGSDGIPQQLQVGDSISISLSEYTSDPSGVSLWIRRTVANPSGTLQAFIGGFPVITTADSSVFQLSYASSEGTKRVTMT